METRTKTADAFSKMAKASGSAAGADDVVSGGAASSAGASKQDKKDFQKFKKANSKGKTLVLDVATMFKPEKSIIFECTRDNLIRVQFTVPGTGQIVRTSKTRGLGDAHALKYVLKWAWDQSELFLQEPCPYDLASITEENVSNSVTSPDMCISGGSVAQLLINRKGSGVVGNQMHISYIVYLYIYICIYIYVYI